MGALFRYAGVGVGGLGMSWFPLPGFESRAVGVAASRRERGRGCHTQCPLEVGQRPEAHRRGRAAGCGPQCGLRGAAGAVGAPPPRAVGASLTAKARAVAAHTAHRQRVARTSRCVVGGDTRWRW
jgi:hypothetical protein